MNEPDAEQVAKASVTALKVVSIGKPVADEKLVAVLEDLLANARCGKIRSFVGVAFHPDTHYGERIEHNARSMQGIGAAYMLLSWLTANWENAPSLPDPPGPAA